jgi:hypothetical protein
VLKELTKNYARTYLVEAVIGIGYISILTGNLNPNFLYDVGQLPAVYNDTSKDAYFRFVMFLV